MQPKGARATLRSVCTRHDIYVVLESAKRSATGSGVSRHVGKTAATGWHRGSGHRACGQRAVPPESNAVPIRNPAASACPSRPFRASFLLCLTHCHSHIREMPYVRHTRSWPADVRMSGARQAESGQRSSERAAVVRWRLSLGGRGASFRRGGSPRPPWPPSPAIPFGQGVSSVTTLRVLWASVSGTGSSFHLL